MNDGHYTPQSSSNQVPVKGRNLFAPSRPERFVHMRSKAPRIGNPVPSALLHISQLLML
jgi:hypothetical protein